MGYTVSVKSVIKIGRRLIGPQNFQYYSLVRDANQRCLTTDLLSNGSRASNSFTGGRKKSADSRLTSNSADDKDCRMVNKATLSGRTLL